MFNKFKKKSIENAEKTKVVKVKKTEKEEKAYRLHKTSGLKILRIIFWCFLAFLMGRGVAAIIRPDQTKELLAQVQKAPEEIRKDIRKSEEIRSFAENFARQWLTYTKDGGEDLKTRLQGYVSANVLKVSDVFDLKIDSRVDYVSAYRMEQYSENHFDVYVQTNVVTITYVSNEDPNTQETTPVIPVYANTAYTLRIPLQVAKDGYVVEDIPLMVSDTSYYQVKEYDQEGVVGLEQLPEEQLPLIQEALTNFLTALYTEKQSVIDYYLDPEANKDQFCSLSGQNTFILVGITSLKAYKKEETDTLCILQYKIQDTKTQMTTIQQCNLVVDAASTKGRVYIKSLDTKTINIKQ